MISRASAMKRADRWLAGADAAKGYDTGKADKCLVEHKKWLATADSLKPQ